MGNKIFIPVILGTTREGRMSKYVADFIFGEINKIENVESEIFDVKEINLSSNDEGEQIKNETTSDKFNKADAFVIVAPEYNHGYPGSLKHFLDSNLKEYIHKAVGICGVSAGPFGGTRVIQNLLPVMRELGLVTIFWDGNYGSVQDLFDENGKIKNDAYYRRTDKFLGELIWMAKTLKYGRENISI